MSALRKPEPYCCNNNCQQSRTCPVRQACELPEPSKPWRFHFGLRSLWLHIRLCWLKWARHDMTAKHHPELHEVLAQIADIEHEIRRLG